MAYYGHPNGRATDIQGLAQLHNNPHYQNDYFFYGLRRHGPNVPKTDAQYYEKQYIKHYIMTDSGQTDQNGRIIWNYKENPEFWNSLAEYDMPVFGFVVSTANSIINDPDIANNQPKIFEAQVAGFTLPEPVDPGQTGTNTHVQYYLTPITVVGNPVQLVQGNLPVHGFGLLHADHTNTNSLTANFEKFYLDVPNKRVQTPALSTTFYTEGDFQHIVHEITVDLKMNTMLTEIVKNTNLFSSATWTDPNGDDHYDTSELFPVFGNVVQDGQEHKYSVDKYHYSPNEIFSYFNNEWFSLGVDEEGHFMLEIKKNNTKFELEISESFLQKYDLQTTTIAYQSDANVAESEYWITTGKFDPTQTANNQPISDETPRYIQTRTDVQKPDPFTEWGQRYIKLQDSQHKIAAHQVTIGDHQVPEQTNNGTYIYSCGGFEEALRSNGRVTCESMNEFAEVQIVSVGLGFNPQVGTDSNSLRVLASFEVPFPYDIQSSGNPFKVCQIQVPPIGDLIILPSVSQYLSLTSPESIRYLRFMVQKVKRTGEADYVFLPPRGRVALKLRFLITK